MKNAIVITNVDSLLGYALAYRFLEGCDRSALKSKTEFRLLCHDCKGLEDLERLGAKIIEVQDFKNEKALSKVMKNVVYVMFIPEYSKTRVEDGEAVLKAAKKENVDYLAMFSYLGLEGLDEDVTSETKMKHLHQMRCLEKQVADGFDKKSHCIVQSAMWSQFFYYFGPMMEDENQIKLTVHKKAKWGCIELADMVDAVYNLSDNPNEQGETNLGQIYVSNLKKKNCTLFRFTARHNFSAEQLVEHASQGLERSNMTYEKIDSDSMFDYLRRLHKDNRFRVRPHHSSMDRPYTFPLGRYLNDEHIETLIEYLQLIDRGKADTTTDTLTDALDHEPQDIGKFFKKNRNQFNLLR